MVETNRSEAMEIKESYQRLAAKIDQERKDLEMKKTEENKMDEELNDLRKQVLNRKLALIQKGQEIQKAKEESNSEMYPATVALKKQQELKDQNEELRLIKESVMREKSDLFQKLGQDSTVVCQNFVTAIHRYTPEGLMEEEKITGERIKELQQRSEMVDAEIAEYTMKIEEMQNRLGNDYGFSLEKRDLLYQLVESENLDLHRQFEELCERVNNAERKYEREMY